MVGDLHGCYSLLMQELQNIHFDFQNDVLICTGDLVDRGAENLACISLLDEAWFYTVRGNHEEMCIKSAHDPKIKEIHARNGGEWFYQLSQIQRLEIIERFKQLPLVIEVQLKNKKIGVVHADIDIHDWNVFKQDICQGDYKISGVTSAYTNAQWGEDVFVSIQLTMMSSKILTKFTSVIQLSKSRHKLNRTGFVGDFFI